MVEAPGIQYDAPMLFLVFLERLNSKSRLRCARFQDHFVMTFQVFDRKVISGICTKYLNHEYLAQAMLIYLYIEIYKPSVILI